MYIHFTDLANRKANCESYFIFSDNTLKQKPRAIGQPVIRAVKAKIPFAARFAKTLKIALGVDFASL